MSEPKFERIEGGWKNVPPHMKTKTQLNEMGLKPGADSIGEVWSYKVWIQLYDVADAIPKKKATEKQLEALEKARKKAAENRTCVDCKDVLRHKKYVWHWEDEVLCKWCYRERKAVEEQKRFQQKKEHFTRVAGPIYNNRQDVIKKMTDKTPLFLERQPSNPFDENAIKVLALVEGEKQQIGYLHRQFAEKFAPMMDHGEAVGIENRGITWEEYGEWQGYIWIDGEQIRSYDDDLILGVSIRLYLE